MKIRKVLKKAGKIGKAMVEGFGEGIDRVMEIRKETDRFGRQTIDPRNGEIVLDAKTLEQIRWMSVSQIRMIIGGKKVRLVNEPGVWTQMRWMSNAQLEAIFGKEVPKEGKGE